MPALHPTVGQLLRFNVSTWADPLSDDSKKRAGNERPDRRPDKERRATHRVADEQKSGQGSLSALSKLRMLERKRAQNLPSGDDPTE